MGTVFSIVYLVLGMEQPWFDDLFGQVPGMVAHAGIDWLYYAARESEYPIVEIGSSAGRSTVALCLGSRDGNKVKVYAVDPFNGGGATPDGESPDTSVGNPGAGYKNAGVAFDEFWRNIERFGVGGIVVPIKNYSELARSEYGGGPIGLLFVDGDHRYNYVKLDFDLWSPLLVKGGWLAMHDAGYPGPGRVIEEDAVAAGFPDMRWVHGENMKVCRRGGGRAVRGYRRVSTRFGPSFMRVNSS